MVLNFDYMKKPGKTQGESWSEGFPLISVITPYFNAGCYFEETFNCISNQTFPWYEWIIVDDGSTDKEDVAKLNNISQRDSRIKLFHKKNQGPSAARNFGVEKAMTELILFVDADDLFEPVYFEYLFWALMTNTNAGFSYTDSVAFGSQHYVWRRQFSSQRMKVENLLPVTALVRKKAFQEVGGYPVEDQFLYEDWQLWLNLLASGHVPVHTQLFGFWYRRNETGVFSTLNNKQEEAAFARAQVDEAAALLQQEVFAIEYPQAPNGEICPNSIVLPPQFKKKKEAPYALVLIRDMMDGPNGIASLALIKQLCNDGFKVGVCSLLPGDPTLQQAYLEITDEVFNLPGFITLECTEMFLNSYIQTRQVDVLLMDNAATDISFSVRLREKNSSLFLAAIIRDKVSFIFSKSVLPSFDWVSIEYDDALKGTQLDSKIALYDAYKGKHVGASKAVSNSIKREYEKAFHESYKLKKSVFDKEAFTLGASDQPVFHNLKRDMLSGKPLITIITVCRSNTSILPEFCQSVMNQSFPWFTWYVIYQREPDESHVLLDALPEIDNRIHIINCDTQKHASIEEIVPPDVLSVIHLPLDNYLDAQYLESVFWGLYANPKKIGCFTDSHQTNNAICCYAIRRNYLSSVIKKDASIPLIGPPPLEESVIIHQPLFWDFSFVKGDAIGIPCGLQSANIMILDTFCNPQHQEWMHRLKTGNSKPRILLIAPWMVVGGADQFNISLLTGLQKKGCFVSIITTESQQDTWRYRFQSITSEVHSLPAFLSPDQIIHFVDYFIQTREIEVIIVSNSAFGYYMMPWLRKNFPNVVLVDYVHAFQTDWHGGGFGRHSNSMSRYLDHTYTCNQYCCRQMANVGRDLDEMDTVYIGVDTAYYARELIPKGSTYSQLGIATDRPIVAFVCRMSPEKRPFLMLHIAKKLAKGKQKVAFVAVGEGIFLESMKSFVEEHELADTVFFAGEVGDVRCYYKDAALTLICSYSEGLALTAYESMSMGTPVISSDVGGQKELINDENGILVPLIQENSGSGLQQEVVEKEVDLYVAAIESTLSDPVKYEKMREQCRLQIIKSFSIDKMVDRFNDEFTRLIKEKSYIREKGYADNTYIDDGMADELVCVYSEYTKSVYARRVQEMEYAHRTQMFYEKELSISNLNAEIGMIKNSLTYRLAFGFVSIIANIGTFIRQLVGKGLNGGWRMKRRLDNKP